MAGFTQRTEINNWSLIRYAALVLHVNSIVVRAMASGALIQDASLRLICFPFFIRLVYQEHDVFEFILGKDTDLNISDA